jgi:hypothetical protein
VPAAAVIPAPIAYIKVVAVKSWICGVCHGVPFLGFCRGRAILGWNLCGIRLSCRGCPSFTVKKLECSKQAYAVEYISME